MPASSLRLPLVGVLLLLLAFSGWAQTSLPAATGYVNDFAGVLESTARTELDSRLKTLAENSNYELAVAVFDEMPADYEDSKELATALFNEWGVGKADEDTGVLILLCIGARRVEIETGYGVESILPDVRCGQLLQEYAVPAFKKDDWAGGLVALAGAIIPLLEAGEPYGAADSELSPEAPVTAYHRDPMDFIGEALGPFLVLVFVVLIIFFFR